jgi:ribonuclease BN (tRNA processing enzyme)
MEIKVLGCSGGEFPGSNAPAFLLDNEILFDAGSLANVLSEQAQMKIKHIFITHAHLDHIRGIPFLADNIITSKTKRRVNILSISSVIRTIRRNLLNSAVWPDFTVIPHPDNAILKMIALKAGRPVKVNSYTVTAHPVHHTVPAVGYLVEDARKRRFFYTGDTGPTPETWQRIGNTQIHGLIIDVSFPNGMRAMALKTGHLTPRLLREDLMKMQHMPEYIYITHPKPQHFETIKKELAGLKIKKLSLLRDGETIRI